MLNQIHGNGRDVAIGRWVGREREGVDPYSTYYVIIVGKMCLAVLAAEDLGRVEVDVVCEAHLRSLLPQGLLAMLKGNKCQSGFAWVS